MRSYPEIGIWELVSGTPCFGPHRILRRQNPLTAWYLGPNTSSLAVRVPLNSLPAWPYYSLARAANKYLVLCIVYKGLGRHSEHV